MSLPLSENDEAVPALPAPAAAPPAPAAAPPARPSLLRRFCANRVCAAALALLLVLLLVAVLAHALSPQNPYDLATVSVIDSELRPGSTGYEGQAHYWLGTDGAGRDLLSAIFYGIRISVGVGVISAVVALMVGSAVGLAAAYFGGVVDAAIMRVVDLQLSLPAVLVALILLAVLGQGVDKTLLALVIVQWAYFARTVRGAAQVERRKEYVEAALGQGLPALRVMFRHILPNCMAPLVVTGTLQIAHAITLEATMSFLGIGLPRTQPSLGMLIANGFEYMLSNKYWISVFPGVALVLLIGSINLVGDRLRRVLNPRLEA
ncbi:putative ABC-type dipeptide transport system, membrane component [Cupriavidus taiwanensis]|uniref:Peptide/nickel transport system permease protein n=1 Tax=Cupriavidus taiwanensis TaxID=164546 RepID=A0A976FWQ1_9BURK|nr:ABC transporter permease [Cupriavidus taiwanensis]SOY91006.1 putative ABC-type dipeptide transport system, membrane component [Cupriavidus taiwanensis]SOY91658.1 putative ABC-type dipeptide transport system, membrane component [Cupriavidus taiwanensis]SPD64200.1 Peptide/nickel transport system permease protein [Cupriavidus taiwanensis]